MSIVVIFIVMFLKWSSGFKVGVVISVVMFILELVGNYFKYIFVY